MKSTFEKMGGTYTLGADGIYYPNLVSTDEEPHYGKYGMMRKTYLKEHRPAMYSLYMLEDRLTEHLNTVDDEAQERMDILVAVFPDPMFWLAELLGIQSPANMVFLFVIFILLIKTFNLTLEISQLQYKIQELVQKIALDENKKNKEADKEEK